MNNPTDGNPRSRGIVTRERLAFSAWLCACATQGINQFAAVVIIETAIQACTTMHSLGIPLAIATTVSLVPLAATLAPRAGEPVVVVAPFATAGAIGVMARADGRLLAASRLEALVVADSENPEFVTRLYKAGAWLVISGRLLTGCARITG